MARKAVFQVLLTYCIIAVLILFATITTAFPRGSIAVMHAQQHLGADYKLGKSGPEQFDCSGLIRHCFADFGIDLPHSAEALGTDPRYMTIRDPRFLCVGDLIFFDTVRDNDPCDHVGIWMGNNKFIHASSGKDEVTITELDGYHAEHYTWGKRYILPFL